MNEYNQYVTAVNKIFDYLAKMKAGWKSLDNENYIENIEEYKQVVINGAEQFKKPKAPATKTAPTVLTDPVAPVVPTNSDPNNNNLEVLGK